MDVPSTLIVKIIDKTKLPIKIAMVILKQLFKYRVLLLPLLPLLEVKKYLFTGIVDAWVSFVKHCLNMCRRKLNPTQGQSTQGMGTMHMHACSDENFVVTLCAYSAIPI